MIVRPVCLHCRAKWVTRPRGLCWPCYYTSGMRDLYPPVSDKGRRGPGTGNRAPPPPEIPTAHLPGTEGKIRVLEERVAAGEGLWHPDDEDGE